MPLVLGATKDEPILIDTGRGVIRFRARQINGRVKIAIDAPRPFRIWRQKCEPRPRRIPPPIRDLMSPENPDASPT